MIPKGKRKTLLCVVVFLELVNKACGQSRNENGKGKTEISFSRVREVIAIKPKQKPVACRRQNTQDSALNH